MERARTKALEYAEKVRRVSETTILDHMSGYQAAQHDESVIQLQAIKSKYEENGIELPKKITDQLTKLESDLVKFDDSIR